MIHIDIIKISNTANIMVTHIAEGLTFDRFNLEK